MVLVDELVAEGYLKTPSIISAFRKIKREDFMRAGTEDLSEENMPVSIGYGQTISQPLTVALMLELLEPGPGQKILDVGSGSGWTTALLAELTGENGRVWGLELIIALCEFGRENLAKYGLPIGSRAEVLCRDGYEGLQEQAPFDRILVSAAATAIPKSLLDQLNFGGRLVIPIGEQGQGQVLTVVQKNQDGSLSERRLPGFAFVPLVKPK